MPLVDVAAVPATAAAASAITTLTLICSRLSLKRVVCYCYYYSENVCINRQTIWRRNVIWVLTNNTPSTVSKCCSWEDISQTPGAL